MVRTPEVGRVCDKSINVIAAIGIHLTTEAQRAWRIGSREKPEHACINYGDPGVPPRLCTF